MLTYWSKPEPSSTTTVICIGMSPNAVLIAEENQETLAQDKIDFIAQRGVLTQFLLSVQLLHFGFTGQNGFKSFLLVFIVFLPVRDSEWISSDVKKTDLWS